MVRPKRRRGGGAASASKPAAWVAWRTPSHPTPPLRLRGKIRHEVRNVFEYTLVRRPADPAASAGGFGGVAGGRSAEGERWGEGGREHPVKVGGRRSYISVLVQLGGSQRMQEMAGLGNSGSHQTSGLRRFLFGGPASGRSMNRFRKRATGGSGLHLCGSRVVRFV